MGNGTHLYGQRIKELLHSRSLTQEELARQSSLHVNTIRRASKGEGGLSLAAIQKIADALNVRLSDLVEEESPSIGRYKMTGNKFIDQKLHDFLRLRSMPPGSERDALEHETHLPPNMEATHLRHNGICASPLYGPDHYTMFKRHGANPVKIRTVSTHGYDLYGIPLRDELRLNDTALAMWKTQDLAVYRPICAMRIGQRVAMIVETSRTIYKEPADATRRRMKKTNDISHTWTDWPGQQVSKDSRTVLTEYTQEVVGFSTNIEDVRPDRPLLIGFKLWQLLPELRPASVKLFRAPNYPDFDPTDADQ